MSKLTKSARGEECTVRIPGICNFDPATTVLCHLPGGGMGAKMPDWAGAFGCSSCHAIVDAQHKYQGPLSETGIRLCFYEGVIRTQAIWFEMGLLEVK